MKKELIKPFVWGIVVGALVLLIVVFATGWVVTSKSAETAAVERVENAVIDRLVKIGIAQFEMDPNREALLNELKEVDYWKSGEFIASVGWATMPGDDTADSKVADKLARQLRELD